MRDFPKLSLLLAGLFLLILAIPADSYSVLSHEAIVDAIWGPVISPMLLKRYPTADEAQMREAHAYAYGGAVVQDMGYYPFGNRLFSDLTHYVRTGDFVVNMLGEAHDMYEYAFALGALAHYSADITGHPIAVNLSVPQVYPKLERKYGKVVTYEDDPKAHIMVEFSFDVAEIAGAGYVPKTYENFIGFKVAKPVLERAFERTYGLTLKDLFGNEDLAINTYRRGASEVIPHMTEIAWRQKKEEILKADPSKTRRAFVYRFSRSRYRRDYGTNYRAPSFVRREWRQDDAKMSLLARFLVFLVRILPKVGPLQTLKFKPPTPQTEQLFAKSFAATLSVDKKLFAEARTEHLTLVNKNLDTGIVSPAGLYGLADKTYAKWLDRLAANKFQNVTPDLRNDILSYYGDMSAPIATKANPKEWQKVLEELAGLKAAPLQPVRAASEQAR